VQRRDLSVESTVQILDARRGEENSLGQQQDHEEVRRLRSEVRSTSLDRYATTKDLTRSSPPTLRGRDGTGPCGRIGVRLLARCGWPWG
jgi:hypothetical protein